MYRVGGKFEKTVRPPFSHFLILTLKALTKKAKTSHLRSLGPSPRFLQQLQVPLVPFEDCKLSTTFKVTSNMFCAGYGQDTIGDSCKGDSGESEV